MARRVTARIESTRAVFMISVAAELAEMHPQTLRQYEERGLITPKRSAGGTRLYSQDDVDRLRQIQQMTAELGMNLAGVERVLEMEAQIERMARRIEQLERRQERHLEELEAAKRALRAEVVVFQETSRAVVPTRRMPR